MTHPAKLAKSKAIFVLLAKTINISIIIYVLPLVQMNIFLLQFLEKTIVTYVILIVEIVKDLQIIVYNVKINIFSILENNKKKNAKDVNFHVIIVKIQLKIAHHV